MIYIIKAENDQWGGYKNISASNDLDKIIQVWNKYKGRKGDYGRISAYEDGEEVQYATYLPNDGLTYDHIKWNKA